MASGLIRKAVTKLGGIPSISGIKDRQTRDALNAIKQIIEVREGSTPKHNILDKVLTVRDLYDSNIVSINSVTGAIGGGSAVGGTTAPNLSVPPAPTGLVVTGALFNIILEWGDPFAAYSNHGYTEIWRSQTNDIGTAVKVATSQGSMHVDAVGYTGLTVYYWLRFVSNTDVAGPYNAVGGTAGGTGLIDGVDLTDSIITAQKIANGAVDLGGAKITGLLANLNLAQITDATKIADGLIGNTKLANLAVDATKLSDGSLELAKFASGLTPVEIVATLPVSGNTQGRTVLLTTDNKIYRYTGAAWTAAVPATDISGQITGTQITDNAITTPKISANAITANEIGANSIWSGSIQTGAVKATQISAGAVVAGKIATNAIIAGDGVIGNAAITTALIANLAVGSAQIANTAITSAKIGTAAIGTAAIQTGAITNALIGNLAVDDAKIANATISAAKIASINADVITAGTITGRTLRTAASGKRFEVSSGAGEAYLYDIDGVTVLCSLGLKVSGTDTIIGDYGHAAASQIAIRGRSNTNKGGYFSSISNIGAHGYSNTNTGVYGETGSSAGVQGRSFNGYGAKFGVVLGQPGASPLGNIVLEQLYTGSPNFAADKGTILTTGPDASNATLNFNKNGLSTGWGIIPHDNAQSTTGAPYTAINSTTVIPRGFYNYAVTDLTGSGFCFFEINVNGAWISTTMGSSYTIGFIWSDGTNVRIRSTNTFRTALFYYRKIA